ncbi:hypothetical protein BT93_K0818 [Corymbia citriodora subsp. variegata]|nr:hypothetical protein BT93_K0818 [Corymbia citriodora subsp. variegata]
MLHSGSVPRTSTCPPSLQRPRLRLQRAVPATLRVSASLPDSDKRFKVEFTPWLIVGLGNPGNKYHGTRHNVGFEMIERISQAEGILLNTIQSKALIGIGCIGEVPLVLAKPQAYMNFSGESVYDDMSLPNGVMRLQPKGGHGHHSGYWESTRSYGCESFPFAKVQLSRT